MIAVAAKLIAVVLILQCAPTAAAQTTRDGESREVAKAVLDRLDEAWNKGDGVAFAGQFTRDAELVNIFGGQYAGRDEITKRMQAIFSTMFKGSVLRSRTIESVTRLGDGVIVSVSSAVVDVPSGPQAPRMNNRQTAIMVREDGQWRIRHWHNTLIRDPQ